MPPTEADNRYAQWVLRDLPSDATDRTRMLDRLRQAEDSTVVRVIDRLVGGCDLSRYTPTRARRNGDEGELWDGEDENGRSVVIKKSLANLPAHRLEQMRSVFASLTSHPHPNIVRVLAHGFQANESRYWVVMEDVGESTWADQTKQEAQHPPDPLALSSLVAQLARAIDHAHRVCGLVHCDLKPSNVVFTPTGVPKIIDWDAAVPLDRGPSARWQSGTPGYAAPEQVKIGGWVRRETDVHGLGAILYSSIAEGRSPYAGTADNSDLQTRTRQEYPLRPENLPASAEPLWRVARWCFWKRPANRFRSAAAVADHLSAVSAGQPVQLPERLPVLRQTLEHCYRRPELVRRVYAPVAVLPLVALVFWMGSAVIGRAVEEARMAEITRERDARRNKLIEAVNRREYTARTVEDSEQVARENPEDPIAQLSCFALQLRTARTDAERAAAVRQVSTSGANTESLRTLCQQLASLHRLLALSVSQYGGLDPLTDEEELNRLVDELGKLPQTNPTLAQAIDTVRPLRDLCRAGWAYSQDTEMRLFREKRLTPPPPPFSHIGFRVALYRRAERLSQEPATADTPELLYHLGVTRFALGEFLFRTPPPVQGASQPPSLDEVIRTQLVESILACRQARERFAVSCTSAPLLELKAWASEALATVYLLRTTPDLPPDVSGGVGQTLTALLKLRPDDDPSSYLLARTLLIGLLIAPQPEQEAVLWQGREKAWEERREELHAYVVILRKEWEEKEKKLAETAPDLVCPSELQNAIVCGFRKLLPEKARNQLSKPGTTTLSLSRLLLAEVKKSSKQQTRALEQPGRSARFGLDSADISPALLCSALKRVHGQDRQIDFPGKSTPMQCIGKTSVTPTLLNGSPRRAQKYPCPPAVNRWAEVRRSRLC